uniref:Uncharacterized protein n=1 Tax=Aegilops tauschii subsp. strangulata TaxID=200361 RepID=A0A453EXC4_AEGTS
MEPTIRLPSQRAAGQEDDDSVGTRWAVLIAGSNGYYNYRHQVRTRYTALCSFASPRSSIFRSCFVFLSVNSWCASPEEQVEEKKFRLLLLRVP